MEYLPVGKRTRSQRAKMVMEQNKRARLAAKREWRKKKEEMFEGKVGIIKDEILEEGSEAMVIDEEEFLKGVKFHEHQKNSQIQELGIVTKEVFDFDDDEYDDGNRVLMIDNNVNDGESDDSLQILGEKWNPLGLDDAYDDDDDGEDLHDDGCHPFVEISSDDNDDGDFEGKDDESSSSSDKYSSSACSVIEEDENSNVLLFNEDGICKLSDKNEKKEKFYENVEELRHNNNNKIKEKNYVSEVKKRGSIEEEGEAKEVEKVSGVKRKRGRPRKVESSQSMIKVRKPAAAKDEEENSTGLTDFYLPLKFNFGVENLVVHKKSEDDLEVDEIFKELDISLKPCNICATSQYDYDGDSEDIPLDNAVSQEELCAKGKHYLILDDEVGLICKFCSYVNLEIRHVMPDFNKDPLFLNENSKDVHDDGCHPLAVEISDDDEDDDGVCYLSHKNEKRGNLYDNVRKLRHDNKIIKEKIYDSELKKRVSTEEEEKMSGEKRKRGRPRKNKSLTEVEVESSQPNVKVKKLAKEEELQNIILNSIIDSTDIYLPLKFQFGVEKLVVHKKSEDELEVDKMFKELDISLQACNICAASPYDYDGGSEDVHLDDAILQKDLCAKGKHRLIVDDEIGLICKFCSYVNLEIRHVMPDFIKYPFRREGNRRDNGRFRNENGMAGDGVQIPNSSYDRESDHLSPADADADAVEGTVWDLIPGVKEDLYPHQREGFEFIWKNISGGIKIEELGKATASGLGGCIIRHDPGTGKTRLATVFLHSFMKQYQMVNPLIIAPCGVLHIWEKEFASWKEVDIPFFNLNEDHLSGKEDPKFLTQAGYTRNIETIRSIKLSTWASGKGVVGVSYQLFRELTGEEKEGTSKKLGEILLKNPGIVVLDEGHIARNEESNLWKVLCQISTNRRVMLTGTPFQNNFEELHNLFALVRRKIRSPVLSTYYEQDDRRIEDLKKRIEPFVHIHKDDILRDKLKGIFHSRIILNPSNLQKRCFQHLPRINTTFTRDCLVAITSVHPSILCYGKVKKTSTLNDDALMDLLEKHKTDLDAGVKVRFLVELIKMSKGERVLVFGQYLDPLEFIANFLKAAFGWNMGSELLYINGDLGMKDRESRIRLFNDPKSEARVLLASTKACSEGIHLVGGSRVVLLDVVWNPSVERQAISRAYRLGQEKEVFVYHLISGSLEEAKYQKQAAKERLSELMFSSEESMEKVGTSSKISEDRVLEELIHHERMKHLFLKVIKQPKFDKLMSFSMDP